MQQGNVDIQGNYKQKVTKNVQQSAAPVGKKTTAGVLSAVGQVQPRTRDTTSRHDRSQSWVT